MFFKQVNRTFTLSLLCAALLFSVACDKTPESATEVPESTQPATASAEQAPEASENAATASPKQIEKIQANTAAMRDQFQKEANTSITNENAKAVLAEIEKELNEEMAELDREVAPTPAN